MRRPLARVTNVPRRAALSMLDVGRRALVRFVELEGFDRAMALAGQGFAALLPLLILFSSVTAGTGRELTTSVIDRFDLSGSAASTLRALTSEPTGLENGISTLSAFILVVSALSFTRAMQRLYIRAWRLPSLGVRGNGWGLIWLAAFVAFWSVQPAIVDLFGGVLEVVAALTLSALLWLFTPWILLARRLPWRLLAPQALLTSFGLTALGAASVIYMPRAVESAATEFGFIGLAFALLSFLFTVFFVVVVAAALGATLVEPRLDRHVSRS